MTYMFHQEDLSNLKNFIGANEDEFLGQIHKNGV